MPPCMLDAIPALPSAALTAGNMIDLHSFSESVLQGSGYFNRADTFVVRAVHASSCDALPSLTFPAQSIACRLRCETSFDLSPLGDIHTPSISADSETSKCLRVWTTPSGPFAVSTLSAPASVAFHVPLSQWYLTKYHQLLSGLRAPPVTSINDPQLLIKRCILSKTSSGSSPD